VEQAPEADERPAFPARGTGEEGVVPGLGEAGLLLEPAGEDVVVVDHADAVLEALPQHRRPRLVPAHRVLDLGGVAEAAHPPAQRVQRLGTVPLAHLAEAPQQLGPLLLAHGVDAGENGGGAGGPALLQPAEVQQLIAFSDEITRKFQQHDDRGQPAAADVEFAFVGGRLSLLQIRPFNESRQAQASAHLAKMDQSLDRNLERIVNMRETLK